VFDGEPELIAASAEMQQGIRPSKEVGAAAECLAGIECRILPRVMYQQDGQSKGTGQLAQSGEDGRDLGGIVLIDSLQTHVGIEYQEPWPILLQGAFEAAQIFLPIQAYRGFDDQMHGQRAKVGATHLGQAGEPIAQLPRGVLGTVDEHGSGSVHGIVS
jgi:hypothetical protein